MSGKKLIECVPNFSEGRDMGIIKQITNEIEAVEGCKLIDVDPGKATNRTVVTFVGTPDEVIEAAFRATAQPMFALLFLLLTSQWKRLLCMLVNWQKELAKSLIFLFTAMSLLHLRKNVKT